MCAEQYSRNTNLEFAGIAVTEGENLKEIMMKIAETISEPWDPSDIDVIHRLPTRQQGATPKIDAQFVSRTKRDRWLPKRKIKFMFKDIVNTNSTKRVYISEHLSDQWMHLLWKAKKVGRPKGYQYIWFHKNKLLAKKRQEDMIPLQILSEDDLGKLV